MPMSAATTSAVVHGVVASRPHHERTSATAGARVPQKHVPEKHVCPVMHEAPHVDWLTPHVVPPSRFGLPMPAQTPPSPSNR